MNFNLVLFFPTIGEYSDVKDIVGLPVLSGALEEAIVSKKTKVYSVMFRRLRGDLIETYKICNGLYDPVTTSTLFDVSSHDKTRSNGLKVNGINTVYNNFKHLFTNRIINVWNGLLAHVMMSDSVNSFKNHIDKLFKEHMYSLKIDISHH